MEVTILNSPDAACDAFVGQKTESKICHLYAWGDMIANYIGLKNFYLVAREQGQIHGVLPLMQVRSRLFGNRMVSQAFSSYGGSLADSQQVHDALFQYVVKLATELGCESIEFRNTKSLPYDLQTRTGKISMYLPLNPDPENVWKYFVPKVKNQVRKAEKSGIIASSGASELLDEFYNIYTIRMHQLGTPCYPRKLMQGILQRFGDNSRIFVVRLGNLCVGAGFTMCFNGFVEIPWAATLVEYNNLCPNNLLYWSIMKHYCLAGARCFDFGRCTIGERTYQFKKQWGSEPIEFYYQYWVHPEHKLTILSPDNPKYQRKVQIWRKLPLWATKVLGSYIGRSLP
jgi:FemAB-related protein (PEP-CTERM system-associated)